MAHLLKILLKLHDRETGYQPEVAQVGGGYTVGDFKRRHTDEEVGERNLNSSSLIFAVDLPDTKSQRRCDRMNGQGRQQFFDKLLPLQSPLRCTRTGRTMGQFN